MAAQTSPETARRSGRDIDESKPYAGIHIGRLERIIINVFTICDGINALTDRRYFQDRPYAYASYLEKAGATTFRGKMKVIWEAKREKTQKIIWARCKYGQLPSKYVRVCKKTPCGRLRLFAAYLN